MAPAVLLVAALRTAAWIAGGLLWGFWALGAGYLLALALLAAFRRGRPAAQSAVARRFCLLIPAHDEELLLPSVLDRLSEIDYPLALWEAVVIADNCTDGTAAVGRTHGARVLERHDDERRGKGFALEWALGELLAEPGAADAYVVMDADSVLSPSFLRVMDAELAAGREVVQARYDVLNVEEAWRARLMACALALAHHVKPLGRMALGLSDGLKGNGMCFSRSVLERVPWSGESITEDIEYTLRLVQAGIRVQYAPDAVVRAQMPVTGRQAATQRQRWEGGRYALLRRAVGLLAEGALRRKPVMIDRAAELLIPPFAELFAVPVAMLAGAAVWRLAAPGAAAPLWVLAAWGAVLASELAYLSLGMAVARVPLTTAVALLWAPAYIVWKLGLYAVMLVRRSAGGWNRTERTAMREGPERPKSRTPERLKP